MNKQFQWVAIVIIGIIAVIALFYAPITLHKGQGYGATTAGGLLAENYLPFVLYNGGYNSAKDISTTAGLYGGTLDTTSTVTETNTGTSTVKLLSTSTTKGFCLQVNATSSNTVLNLTATTTTNASGGASGLVLAYGACN